ncbi:MAG: hypothetical protein RBR45_15235 [Pseudomonas sp.]|nr:hypothetical protein [Pseudomonas sp.]
MATDAQVNEIYRYTVGLFKAAPGAYLENLVAFVDAGNSTQDMALALAGSDIFTGLTSGYSPAVSNSIFATTFINNLVGTTLDAATKQLAIDGTVDLIANQGYSRAQAVVAVIDLLAGVPADDATFGAARQQFDARIERAAAYTENPMYSQEMLSSDITFLQSIVEQSGVTFNIDDTVPSIMRITGDQAVRIDFTNPANQVKGLDINGDGVIKADGIENTISGVAANFTIVDAYSRNPDNHYDNVNNFLGNISFDGTGFDGDGVSTDGNIFLGGLGADRATGGIGNDFMAGGGVAEYKVGEDYLFGGRNADFFFVNLSALDLTEGDRLDIDGGETADDSFAGMGDSAQDSDWLLIEASDDDEPVVVRLAEKDVTGTVTTAFLEDQGGNIDTGDANDAIDITNLENVDASGNLYGFLDGIDVALGEAGLVTGDSENVGIGSSAQLQIYGNSVANIIIGGFDNDYIDGNAGNDLLFGGRLDYLNNPNMLNIVNDGMDALYGGAGNDHLVWEADGGVYEGEAELNAQSGSNDTLWLTSLSLGTRTAADLTTDGALRFDLMTGGGSNVAGGVDVSAGYGGADASTTAAGAGTWTADQTLYKAGVARTTVQDVENVIATGLGAVDYVAAGTNDPDLNFNNQQNLFAYEGDLNLRGTDGANTLYASTGDDVIEGREGNDMLSGGEGNDDFIFALGSISNAGSLRISQDGVDVIHRQVDADGDNIWDGTFGQDFGLDSTSTAGSSALVIDFGATDLSADNVALTSFSIKIDGVTFAVTDQDLLASLTSAAEVADVVNAAFSAQDANVTVVANGNGVVVQDALGREMSDTVSEGYFVGGAVSNSAFASYAQFEPAGISVSQDRLIYVAYEDRADGELRDDNSVLGSNVSLGIEGYAEDLVISFADDGTRIAEGQAYDVTFTNLTTEDIVTLTVNGVQYQLQVGVDLDGNIIAAEDGPFDAQAAIQTAFLTRLTAFINSFMDDDTAAGSVNAALAGSTITLTQNAYNGEETVFMATPTVAIEQLSGGEVASAAVTNVSQHEVHLLDFDGRNGNLNEDNVLFIGNTGENRAMLQTAENEGTTITGKSAVLIDNGADTHAATVANTGEVIADSQATNAWLDGQAAIYSVHGDDFLLGGNGDDDIFGGTGDDRIVGSLGDDTVDGGKNFYAVQVLGESKVRVYELNRWEAANPAQVAALQGLTISSINLVSQSETGVTLANGVFDDTLQFQQADFVAGETEFTITLNDFNMNGSVVELRNDGAGTVQVDVDGDGDFEAITTFTNFENVRTVSGVGRAVAGDGQGNDTLNVSALSTATGGISYDLTNGGNAGEVNYSVNAHGDTDRPVEGDFESLVMRVDGVENVIAGSGDDLLLIDETEAAKDNSFSAGLGDDRVEYQNEYNATLTAEPTVTIKVNTASDTDQVVMTAGRVGSTVATDTLTSVEYVTLAGDTARSTRADDVVDVTAMTSGAVVDYTNGEVRNLSGTVQLTIEGIAQMENVWADGDDTVIVADNATMDDNANYDGDDSDGDDSDITFATFMDYDQLSATNTRVAFADQTSDQIQDVENQGLFTFDLSKTGSGNDTDTVDYSQALDSIATVVMEGANQYVMVDGDAAIDDVFGNNWVDRVDHLIGVERIVASQAESVLDFTQLGEDVEITFQFDANNANLATDTMESIVRIGDKDGNTIEGIPNYVERFDLGQNANVDAFNDAAWNRIEGGDFAEKVYYDGSEDLTNLAGVDHRYTDDTLNLRGGDNVVSYYAMETSIHAVIDVTEFDGNDAANTGLIDAEINFADGTGVYADPATKLAGSGTHTITSHTNDNGIAAGSLKIEASQDAEDSVTFANSSDKVYFLGTSAGVIDVKIGDLDTMRLTGFEFLQDSNTDDVYDIKSLVNVLGNLTLTDDANDHDTIVVGNDAVNYNGVGADTIDLSDLNTLFSFDFDVLDVTGVTASNLILVGEAAGEGTDEVVIDNLAQVATITDFEAVVLNEAALASGTSLTLDLDAGELKQGATTVNYDGTGLSVGGLMFEDADSYVAAATSGVTITVTDDGATGATVVGGDGDDTITGGAGADRITGGLGADVLDGNIVPEVSEVQTITLAPGVLDGTDEFIIYDDVSDKAFAITASGGAALDLQLGVASADEDQIGGALAGVAIATLESALGYALGSIESTAYDAVNNQFSITFTADADYANLSVFVGAAGETALIEGGAAAANDAATATVTAAAAETTAYAAQGEAVDTFVYNSAAESTAASMDQILNFSVGATDDIIDLSAVAAAAPTFHNGVQNGGSAFADYAAVEAAADAYLQTHVNSVFVGSDGTDTWVFADANHSIDLDAGDVVIQLTGIDATGIDATNFNFV